MGFAGTKVRGYGLKGALNLKGSAEGFLGEALWMKLSSAA